MQSVATMIGYTIIAGIVATLCLYVIWLVCAFITIVTFIVRCRHRNILRDDVPRVEIIRGILHASIRLGYVAEYESIYGDRVCINGLFNVEVPPPRHITTMVSRHELEAVLTQDESPPIDCLKSLPYEWTEDELAFFRTVGREVWTVQKKHIITHWSQNEEH